MPKAKKIVPALVRIESDIATVEEVVKEVRILKDTRFTKESSAAANDANMLKRVERKVNNKIIELDKECNPCSESEHEFYNQYVIQFHCYHLQN